MNMEANNSIQDIFGKLKSYLKCSFISPPETPAESGIRGNSVLISFRKAGHAVPTPFLVLGIRVVTIVRTRNGLRKVVISSISISITQFPLAAFFYDFCCCCVFHSQCSRKIKISRPNRNFKNLHFSQN